MVTVVGCGGAGGAPADAVPPETPDASPDVAMSSTAPLAQTEGPTLGSTLGELEHHTLYDRFSAEAIVEGTDLRCVLAVDLDGDGARGDAVSRCEGDPNSVATSEEPP